MKFVTDSHRRSRQRKFQRDQKGRNGGQSRYEQRWGWAEIVLVGAKGAECDTD